MDNWPYDIISGMHSALWDTRGQMDALDPLGAIAQLSRVAEALPEAMTELALIASRAGYTNKRIAQYMNVPPSALRGLKAEARSHAAH